VISKKASALEKVFSGNLFYDNQQCCRVTEKSNGCFRTFPPETLIMRAPQRQPKLTLITPPERHLPCRQKNRKQYWFAGNPATVCSSVYKKWTMSFPITGENQSAHLDQWLNRTGTISSMLPWTREPFALKRKPNELFTPELLQRKRTGLNTKPANNSVLTGLRSGILRCSEKVEIMQDSDDPLTEQCWAINISELKSLNQDSAASDSRKLNNFSK